MWTVQFELSNQEVCSTVGKFASCEFIRTLLYKVLPKIRIQQTYYSKDIILLTFSLTEQHLSKGLQIVVNTNQEQIYSLLVVEQEISISSNSLCVTAFSESA